MRANTGKCHGRVPRRFSGTVWFERGERYPMLPKQRDGSRRGEFFVDFEMYVSIAVARRTVFACL